MYNSFAMRTSASISRLLIAAALCALGAGAAHAQIPQPELPLISKERLFPLARFGVRGIKGGPDGRYYVLTAHVVVVFLADGTKVGEIPAPASKGGKVDQFTYGEAFDVGRDGLIYVADRIANTIRIFKPDGAPVLNLEFTSPTGVVALAGGEFAVTNNSGDHLVSVFDMKGSEVRTFCDPVEISKTPETNQYLSTARLATDAASDVYVAFTFFPEPTVRKFDRVGYATAETVLDTLEFAPASQSIRREMKRQDDRGAPLKLDHQRITAIGVDPESQTMWLTIGDEILRFDKDGGFLMRYTLYMPDGSQFDPNYVFVEKDRLIISTESLGIYEFPRPDKDPALSPHTEKHF
jgi:hypothetical protein